MIIHSGEKPFDCNQCYMTFSTNSNLNIHMQTHTRDIPFQYNQCNMYFIKKNFFYACEKNTPERNFSNAASVTKLFQGIVII